MGTSAGLLDDWREIIELMSGMVGQELIESLTRDMRDLRGSTPDGRGAGSAGAMGVKLGIGVISIISGPKSTTGVSRLRCTGGVVGCMVRRLCCDADMFRAPSCSGEGERERERDPENRALRERNLRPGTPGARFRTVEELEDDVESDAVGAGTGINRFPSRDK